MADKKKQAEPAPDRSGIESDLAVLRLGRNPVLSQGQVGRPHSLRCQSIHPDRESNRRQNRKPDHDRLDIARKERHRRNLCTEKYGKRHSSQDRGRHDFVSAKARGLPTRPVRLLDEPANDGNQKQQQHHHNRPR